VSNRIEKKINAIKAWLYSKTLIRDDLLPSVAIPTVQEDVRDVETKKRIAKVFEQQEKSMRIRALKPHSCIDPLICKKRTCFKHEPDKIISSKIMTRVEVDKELGR
jgi:hypothetical protein